MKRVFVLLVATMFAPLAHAEKMQHINQVVVMQDIQVLPENPSMNSEFTTVRIQARVMLVRVDPKIEVLPT